MSNVNYIKDANRCRDLDRSRRLEWIVTNGRGGFAMASLSGLLTRRYHGLLVAATKPPVERFVLLAKLEVAALVGGLTYELSTNDYPEAVHPTGYKMLESFSAGPVPTWRWRLGETVIEQTFCMTQGEDTTHIRLRAVEGKQPVTLMVRPMCTSRHFHMLTNRESMEAPAVRSEGDVVHLDWPGDRPNWRLSHNAQFKAAHDWYYDFVLVSEAERGQDWMQDLFTPGVISQTLTPGADKSLTITASTQAVTWRDADAAFNAASQSSMPAFAGMAGDTPKSKSGKKGAAQTIANDPLLAPLVKATADYLVSREDGSRTVIAGYPWFEDWGRDTFISLPGLCLVTGRFDDARAIIEGFAQFVDQGMIPNRFPPYGEAPAYNTVDATLWYIHAIDRYLAYTGDWAFVSDRMYKVIVDILESHERGTRHGIGLREDGLLAAGSPGEQLTWMDAKTGDWVVTPRIGKPVEINALWFNALTIAADYAKRMGDRARAERWTKSAQNCRAAFNRRFWNPAGSYLYDVVDADHVPNKNDASLRPNQLIALSLTHPVLDDVHARAVVEACRKNLLTPLGLRTLASWEPGYCPRYTGDMRARDAAYHQGTVWPWLLGPFITAYIRVADDGAAARREARQFLTGLETNLGEAGIGGVSEVADAEPPHHPGGCPWQAWSVAEPLRALCEDILQLCPGEHADTGPLPRKPVAVMG